MDASCPVPVDGGGGFCGGEHDREELLVGTASAGNSVWSGPLASETTNFDRTCYMKALKNLFLSELADMYRFRTPHYQGLAQTD